MDGLGLKHTYECCVHAGQVISNCCLNSPDLSDRSLPVLSTAGSRVVFRGKYCWGSLLKIVSISESERVSRGLVPPGDSSLRYAWISHVPITREHLEEENRSVSRPSSMGAPSSSLALYKGFASGEGTGTCLLTSLFIEKQPEITSTRVGKTFVQDFRSTNPYPTPDRRITRWEVSTTGRDRSCRWVLIRICCRTHSTSPLWDLTIYLLYNGEARSPRVHAGLFDLFAV